ncbi:MAG TPA: hypothetical protein PKA55_02790 [Rhodoblastus sp.]|nr:hypothetical protein [Rhodoblastus sp.]
MHDHDHRHHDHDHDHVHGAPGHAAGDHHGHAHDPSAVVAPGPSLLRMSALDRLAGAAFLSALIWLGVKWAMA